MFFLLRSLICIGLVYALASSDRALAPPEPVGVAGPRAPAPSLTSGRRPQLTDTTKALVQQGVDALGVAARDHCLAAPEGCLAMLRKLNGSRAP